MDTFKLLARSTNLQKSGTPADKMSKQTIPSAGLDSERRSRTTANENLTPSSSIRKARGTKRKRTVDDGAQHPEVLSELKQGQKYASHVNAHDESLPGGLKRSEERLPSNHAEARKQSVDENRHLLKRNKLKITVLTDGRARKLAGTADQSKVSDVSKNKKDARLQLCPEPLTSFGQLRSRFRISKRLSRNLDAQGYRYPTEVQLGSLPILLGSADDLGLPNHGTKEKTEMEETKPHLDLLTVAPTGSGKTLAFMVNVIHRLVEGRDRDRKANEIRFPAHQIQALIIAPTHELADQIVNEGRKLVIGTGVRISAMRKGLSLQTGSPVRGGKVLENWDTENQGSTDEDSSTIRPPVKADILVSTPMLLVNTISEDHSSPSTLLPSVRYLVLDEADVLLDPLFRDQTLCIWSACTNVSLQTTFWSATIGSSIESLVHSTILDRRRRLGITSPHHLLRVVVGLKDSAVPNITHRLTYAATEQGKLLALRQLLHPTAPSEDKGAPLAPPFLVFTQTIQRAVALHSELLYDIPPEAGGSARIAVLHSDLSDSARSAIMAGFRKGEIWILITTDLLSRGIDFRGMNGVVNYDIPTTGASYVHRVGRTGRQGREGGVAVTLYTKEDIPYVKNIANAIAAGERAKAKGGEKSTGDNGMQEWLLDALPSVSKKTRRELKQKGVESRRNPGLGAAPDKEKRRARISTKSGFDRKLEHKRRGAAQGVRLRGQQASPSGSEDEWDGIIEN